MRQKNTKQMLNYWLDLFWDAGNLPDQPGQLIWPERSDIQPATCRKLLGNMFILERDAGEVSYRLAGTALCRMYGREMKRETFANAFVESDQNSATSWVNRLGLDDYVVLMCSVAETERGERINLETLLMPLDHHGARGRRILGITTACDDPYWLGVRPFISQTIKSVRVMRPWEDANQSHDIPVLNSLAAPKFTNLRQQLDAPQIYEEASTKRDEGVDISIFDTSFMDGQSKRVGHLTVIDGGKS